MKQIPTDGLVTLRVRTADARWLERIGVVLQSQSNAPGHIAPGARVTRAVEVARVLRWAAEVSPIVANAEADPEVDQDIDPPHTAPAVTAQDTKARRDASIDAAPITKTASDAERELARVSAEAATAEATRPAKPPTRKARR